MKARSLLFSFFLLGLACGRAEPLLTAPRGGIFQAGQALTLRVALDTAGFINGGYPIDSAGYADLPVLGRVFVDGKSQQELEGFLAEKLANYLKDIHVQAIPCIRLTLLGYWTRQGQYYVSPHATVWEAAYQGGGLGGERTLDKIKVWRGDQETGINFLDVYSKGITLEAAGIRSGDIVVVPVPRDNVGFWYWFRESLAVTAQIAGVASTILTAYITILVLDRQ